jgi:chromosome segregation ATPase
MSKDLKDLIDSVDSANQAHMDLETMIRNLKEEVQRLTFTVDEQRTIILNQKSKLSSIQVDNIPEDISLLKDLVTQQRQDIIKKDKDIEILQQTISEITLELENVQKFEGENKELIYANKEIVQLTEENENFRLKVEELNNILTNLPNESDVHIEFPSEENRDLLDAKKLIIKLTEENGINRVQIESSKQEIESLNRQNQENLTLKNQFLNELTGVNKIIDQLTFDNDQYHEKVNYLQQKLEETVKLQEESPEEVGDNNKIEELNKILFELEIENNDFKNLANTNFSIIENLKQRNFDTEKKLGGEINFVNQKISDLQEKVSEKDEELNIINLKLQKFENANIRLSDLIVDLKIKQDHKSEISEFESSIKSFSYEGLPPNLFFRMYKLLGENDKATIVNQLIEDLSNEIRDVRTYAIKVLSVIKGNRVFEVLKKLVNDNDWIVKLYLIKAFRNFSETESIPLLKELQQDKDIDVREAATKALSEFKQNFK